MGNEAGEFQANQFEKDESTFMDSSSNDPLHYLKVIAERAEAQQIDTRKLTYWTMGAVLMLIVIAAAWSALAYGLAVTGKAKRTAVDWNSVCASRAKGDLTKALEMADQLLVKNPGDFDGHYKKGEILLMMGDKEAALKSFQTAQDLFPILKYRDAVSALKPKPKTPVANGTGAPTATPAPAAAKARS